MQSLIELSWTSSHLNWQSLTRLLKFYLHLHVKTWKIILYVLYCYFSPVFYTEWNLKIGHYRIQPKVRRKRNSPSFPIEYPFTLIRINDVSPDERRTSSIIVLKFYPALRLMLRDFWVHNTQNIFVKKIKSWKNHRRNIYNVYNIVIK